MPTTLNRNAKSITLVLVGYSILQIVLFTSFETASQPLFISNKVSLFEISVGCECLLLIESILAIIVISSHNLVRIYRFVSCLFLVTRLLSVYWIYKIENPMLAVGYDIRNNLKIFSLIVGFFETMIVYSQIRMVKNIQTVSI